ncbi:hypothetical protein L1994_03215 [Methanomicrobium antiquum]|uniref:Uncharacterized protein n=1 Tax=Methanomicrobium antiquum TaxID=487686 RepID=A0AAF0FT20_9EURY|nr:hypothetical protein [Methanomicrobium antiquum]WFN37416.1 hypothetical protein L1994_03215 [Methanomicrobium antiquum]
MKRDIKEIKNKILRTYDKPDVLIDEKETVGLMKLSDKSLRKFLEDEPDRYSVSDLKVVYK